MRVTNPLYFSKDTWLPSMSVTSKSKIVFFSDSAIAELNKPIDRPNGRSTILEFWTNDCEESVLAVRDKLRWKRPNMCLKFAPGIKFGTISYVTWSHDQTTFIRCFFNRFFIWFFNEFWWCRSILKEFFLLIIFLLILNRKTFLNEDYCLLSIYFTRQST